MKHCCANCIDDRGLRREIIPTFSDSYGTCCYCETEEIQLIKTSYLRDYFELIVNIYTPDQDGKTLVEWFKEDWGMFSHQKMNLDHSKELLADILDDTGIVSQKFVPSDFAFTDGLKRWTELRKELMSENRFFPQTELDKGRLRGLLSHLLLESDEVSELWYRARLQLINKPFPPEDMGAPPKGLASQGRANPAGIPYLYLASTANTAVSELRPHTGDYASVAIFTVPDNLKIVDLRNPRQIVSPFLLVDEHEIGLLRGDIGFLDQLGDELTRPVLPRAAAIDYIPSQFLCEFIKKCGFNGVMYKSSVDEGHNLALFDPSLAIVGNVESYKVSRVSVDILR